ncbi:hypothetical protein EH243_12300 [Amphritea opalescens]|uniref:Uncharacterized protein n=1 Tax=Amphritea opalescens TaxID=2490544 RepID=A0A430KPM8_9GAMM|nr:hypothetical protein EH243_12300 [Amphritea opalescens]
MTKKPDTDIAMRKLIADIRTAIPFDTPMKDLCNGPCTGCSKKLLDYLDTELEERETALNSGYKPDFGDLNRLKKTALKIHGVLIKNGLMDTAKKIHTRSG